MRRADSLFVEARPDEETVTLYPVLPSRLPKESAAFKWVGRFQAAALGYRCLALEGTATAFHCEQKVTLRAGEEFDPHDRTHVFDKLIKLGQPWRVIEHAAIPGYSLSKWMNRVTDLDRCDQLLCAELWPLLKPIRYTEFHLDLIAIRLAKRRERAIMYDSNRSPEYYVSALVARAHVPVGFTCIDDFALIAIAELVLELRYAILTMNLVRWQAALEACQTIFKTWAKSPTQVRHFTEPVGKSKFTLPMYINWVFGTIVVPSEPIRKYMESSQTYSMRAPTQAEREAYWHQRNMSFVSVTGTQGER